MLVMGIDTSGEIGAVGLTSAEGIIGEINIRLRRQHSERLLPNIDILFKETGKKLNELDGIGVTTGPGSFTGLRIALATVKTLAQVLNIPVIGISSLELLAYNLSQHQGWLVPLIDARRERVYTALFHNWDCDIRSRKTWKEQAVKVSQLIEELEELDQRGSFYFTGDGCQKYRDILKNSGLNTFFAPPSICIPRGGGLAELSRYYLERGKSDNYGEILPDYLKKPQAEIKWLKKKTGKNFNG
ncbi:MAG TPA: tRNA (adenosine(37)-N6)-threonylcarbamoyltransferase complex dimerization subunit type 1 TsaB [Halanaerobiales bacterium]|nr:tRNA (adenosine(37)-N6)-threonylcarbamoyltransferase complex dimerization subunit type 1 TsaB [Halanaerobiales bacterium]